MDTHVLTAVRPEAPAAAQTLRVAVASRDGLRVDLHFGQTEEFLVFDVTAEGAILIARRDIESHTEAGDADARDTACRMLADCKMLLVAKIGINPQEKLARAGIEASDLYVGKPVETALIEVFAAKSVRHTALDTSGFRLMHTMLRVRDLERSLDYRAFWGCRCWSAATTRRTSSAKPISAMARTLANGAGAGGQLDTRRTL